jgi:hypothetical protein
LQGSELHRVGIGNGNEVQEYSTVSPFSEQSDDSTEPLNYTMKETTHQRDWPVEWFGQASAAEPRPLLVCQYCGFVRDDESG